MTALPAQVSGLFPEHVGLLSNSRYLVPLPNVTTTAYHVGVHIAGITAPAASVTVAHTLLSHPSPLPHVFVALPSADPVTWFEAEFHRYTAAVSELPHDQYTGIFTEVIVYSLSLVRNVNAMLVGPLSMVLLPDTAGFVWETTTVLPK